MLVGWNFNSPISSATSAPRSISPICWSRSLLLVVALRVVRRLERSWIGLSWTRSGSMRSRPPATGSTSRAGRCSPSRSAISSPAGRRALRPCARLHRAQQFHLRRFADPRLDHPARRHRQSVGRRGRRRLRGDPAGEVPDHPGVPVRALCGAGDPDPAVPSEGLLPRQLREYVPAAAAGARHERRTSLACTD